MSKTEFTPGPWWPSQNSVGTWEVNTLRDHHVGTGRKPVAYGANICGGIGDITEQRTRGNEQANANLIAAAPDLYEALQSVLAITADSDGVSGYHLNGDIAKWGEFDEIATAIAALAKARGEQP